METKEKMDMDHFLNIKKILEGKKVNKGEIAQLLFPNVRFPRRAFSRILTGEAELSASQVSILADYLKVPIEELYQPDRWLWKDTENGVLIFIYGTDFRAEVELEQWTYVIHYKDKIIATGNVDGYAPVGEVLNELKQRIHEWLDLA